MDVSPLAGLLVVAVLVLANGFFVATEFAIVAVRRSRVQELVADRRAGAIAAQEVVTHLDAYIAATQFGITLASLALGWIGEPAIAHLLEPAMVRVTGDFADEAAHALAIGIAFALITGLHIVVGELAPKGLALQRPEQTTLWVAAPIRVFHTIFKWPVTALNWVGNATLRLIGLEPATGHEMVHSVEELRLLVTGMRNAGVVDETEARVAQHAFDLGETTASAIMTPRTEIEAWPIGLPLEGILEAAARAAHTRIPMYEGSIDAIVGIVHLRRLFPYRNVPSDGFDVRPLLDTPLIVPETKPATDLLEEMQRQQNYVAVIVDEHGGTAGMVTLSDLLEALVGRLDDRSWNGRPETGPPRWLPDGSMVVDGSTRISELAEIADMLIDDDLGRGVETVGGLIAAVLGRVPSVGDRIMVAGRTLVVEAQDGLRVASVRVLPPQNT